MKKAIITGISTILVAAMIFSGLSITAVAAGDAGAGLPALSLLSGDTQTGEQEAAGGDTQAGEQEAADGETQTGEQEAADAPGLDTAAGWAREPINEAFSAALIPAGLQSDYGNVTTRAEFCALAVVLYENVTGSAIVERKPFTDTDDLNVMKMGGLGVVQGGGDGSFTPDGLLNRQMAATLVANLADAMEFPLAEEPAEYSDNGDIADWAIVQVGQMQAAGIMRGYEDGSFGPLDLYARQQSIITMLNLFNSYNSYIASTATQEDLITPYYKAWAIGCHAILAIRNNQDPYLFGGVEVTAVSSYNAKRSLDTSWGCRDREDLLDTIAIMTDYGHNRDFALDYALVSSLMPDEYEFLLAISGSVDSYMWPLTLSLGDKWGDKQLKAWDWFRMTHLIGWGYVAGYIEAEEVAGLMQPIIDRLTATFSSWEEAVENYMDGYAWWSRTDVSAPVSEYTLRLDIYESIKDDEAIFDPSVWG